ncbi:MAG: glycosyltransferase family protein [Polyangiaceae bacterium]|nr:glycosyltransferase family protein [Polyangiaceae bacterium]
MKVVAIVQARLASSRLPAKPLLDLGGATALERCLRRVRRFTGVDEVVVAASDRPGAEILARVAARAGVETVLGDEDDVLSRYAHAARYTHADVVVRCTSDCPLLDPGVSSAVVAAFVADGAAAYASNTLDRALPRGLDTEVMSADALFAAERDATERPAREHVTWYLYQHPVRFRCLSVPTGRPDDLSRHRWTLDTLDDYRLLHAIFDRLGPRADDAGLDDVLDAVRRAPALVGYNDDVAQKPS